jgi:branched-chain amino acid transport system ATP-binding protein
LEKKTEKIIEVEEIHTYYGASHIIQGLSLFVGKGEAVSILGRNGVGKTTTLRSIVGLTPPRRGSIKLEGEEVKGWPPHRIAGKGIAYVPAERNIFPGLTVEENLKLAERPLPQGGGWTFEAVYEYFPILQERKRQDGSTLSGGEQQMLAVARALMGNPRIMLLDEPSQGLSPIMVNAVREIICNLLDRHGLTLLLVEQNYRLTLRIAQRHYLMGTKGKIEQMATTRELQENEVIIQKHLSV